MAGYKTALIKDTSCPHNIWAVSDWHLQHFKLSSIWGTRPSDYESLLLRYYDEFITENDLVIFLGDVMFRASISKPWFAHIAQTLQGKKILVRGNHDYKKTFPDNYWINDCGFSDVHDGWFVLGHILFSHFPITPNPNDLRGAKTIERLNRIMTLCECNWNIHGHVHDYLVPDPRCICACPEQTDYKPVKVTHLIKNL